MKSFKVYKKMVCYKLKWKNSAYKSLYKLPKQIIKQVIESVEKLVNEPRPRNCRKLAGSDSTYRIRIGNYRVVYDVLDRQVIIQIILVGHRKEIYKKYDIVRK